MIFYKTDEEIELIRHNCLLVCKTLAEVAKVLKPGINSTKIDQIAEVFIRDNQAKPGFKGYNDFPDTLCVSVNDVVVHGMPSSNYTFKEGDVVSIDCGVYKNGYFGDAAYTFALGDVPEKTMDLLRTTHESLYRGIERAVA
nr:M24 family metallopeptidase [Saprospiraceae bacterium]